MINQSWITYIYYMELQAIVEGACCCWLWYQWLWCGYCGANIQLNRVLLLNDIAASSQAWQLLTTTANITIRYTYILTKYSPLYMHRSTRHRFDLSSQLSRNKNEHNTTSNAGDYAETWYHRFKYWSSYGGGAVWLCTSSRRDILSKKKKQKHNV